VNKTNKEFAKVRTNLEQALATQCGGNMQWRARR